MASDKIRFRKATKQFNEKEADPFEFTKDVDQDLHYKKTDKILEDDLIDLIDTDGKKSFESVFVLEFHPGVKKKTIHWLVDKIRGKKAHGGVELMVMMEPLTK